MFFTYFSSYSAPSESQFSLLIKIIWYIGVPAGINPEKPFLIIPNPAIGNIYLQFPHELGLPEEIYLFNNLGQTIEITPLEFSINGLLKIQPTTSISSGLIYIRARFKEKLITQKLLFISQQ